MRLLFIAIDCLGLQRFRTFLKSKLDRKMLWGELRAEGGTLCNTGPSWTSIFTGKPASEHGVTHLLGVPQDGSKGFKDLPGQYLFEDLPGTVGCFGLPTTYPPRARPGDWMISGYPFKPAAAPADLLNGLDYIGDYASVIKTIRLDRGATFFWPDEYEWEQAFFLMKIIEEVRLAALRRLPAVEHLFVFNGLYDRAGHQVHHLKPVEQTEPLDQAAQAVAAWTMRVLEEFPADTVVLCSDHGWDQQANYHSIHGFYAMWGAGVEETGRRDLHNYDLRQVIEEALMATDPDIRKRMEALGYA